jgi:hypothetical protein
VNTPTKSLGFGFKKAGKVSLNQRFFEVFNYLVFKPKFFFYKKMLDSKASNLCKLVFAFYFL